MECEVSVSWTQLWISRGWGPATTWAGASNPGIASAGGISLWVEHLGEFIQAPLLSFSGRLDATEAFSCPSSGQCSRRDSCPSQTP